MINIIETKNTPQLILLITIIEL